LELGHWEFDSEFDINDWFGFIYRITNKTTGREYVGKKQFFALRTKAVAGRKNRKHFKKESDWKKYTGSSINLNDDIERLGKENFKFEIVSLHKTKGSLHYREVEIQVFDNVLREKLPSGERKYYNGHIAAVKFIPPEVCSEETKLKISKTLLSLYENKDNHWYNRLTDEEREEFAVNYLRGDNHQTKRGKTSEEYQAWLDENVRGENNPMFGKSSTKGMTFEEIHKENAEAARENLRKKCNRVGEANGMFGKTHKPETVEKWKNNPNRIHAGTNNGMFGKPCYKDMTEEQIQQWKQNISLATKGKPKDEEHKRKIGAANKGKKKPTVTCPHCNKVGAKGNMLRYHFDNCKSLTT